MNLMDLCKEFLVYLVQFREKAPTPAAPTLQQARADVLAILDHMEVHTRREPSLALPFQKARYALVALADEVFCDSGWDRALEWRELTLERQIYQTSRAGDHFFELIDQADPNDQEMTAVYYLCLALGFTGRYEPDHPELAEYKRKLIARLPEEARPELPGKPVGRKTPPAESKPLPKPAKWMVLGGVALLAVVVLVGAGWLFSPDNFLPRDEPAAPAPEKAAEQVTAPALKAADPAKAPPVKAAARQAPAKAVPEEPKAAPETPKAVKKPEKRQLVLVPGRTVTASKAVPQEPATKPKEAAPAQKAPDEKTEAPPEKPKAEEKATPKKAAPKAKVKEAAAKPKKPAPKAGPPARGAYQVFVGSFVGPKQSGRLAARLKSMGYPAKVELLPRPGKKTLYVVKIIPLKNKDEARRVASTVKRKLKLKPMVRPVQ